MARKTLKSALRAHEARHAQADHERKVEEAARRKALSIQTSQQRRGGRVPSKAGKKAFDAQSSSSSLRNAKASKPSSPSSLTSSSVRETARKVKQKADIFKADDTILLVGEGNFSFARSLLLPPHNHSPERLLATAYDTEKQCYEKYPDAADFVAEMRRIAGRDSIVAFGVDAGDLLSCKAIQTKSASLHPTSNPACWSKIVFNFPHVGAGHKDERRNVMANQLLILRFLLSSAHLLSQGPLPHDVQRQLRGKASLTQSKGISSLVDDDEEEDEDADDSDFEDDGQELDREHDGPAEKVRTPARAGSILITLRDCKPYTLWDVPTISKRLTSVWKAIVQGAPAPAKGQRLPTASQVEQVVELGQGRAFRVWQSFVFSPHQWPGYSHRRTIGWRQGVSGKENEDIIRSEQGECRTWQLGLLG